MTSDLEITGPVAAKLWLSSDTTDADVFAALRVFDPAGKERMTQAGNELTGGTPQQAAEFIRAEVARWKKIIKPEMRLSR
jgi:predicted acyl esterase